MFRAALCSRLRLPVRVRRATCKGVIGLALLFSPTAGLMAQAPGGAVPPAPAAGAAPAPVATRPLFMEWVIVAAMVGLSLFVVCKSSRRN